MSADWDVLIIGCSYAGLSAALNLGRARRSVLVVGSGGPRNESVYHVHGLLTLDGAAPADIIAAAESELAKYPTIEWSTIESSASPRSTVAFARRSASARRPRA